MSKEPDDYHSNLPNRQRKPNYGSTAMTMDFYNFSQPL